MKTKVAECIFIRLKNLSGKSMLISQLLNECHWRSTAIFIEGNSEVTKYLQKAFLTYWKENCYKDKKIKPNEEVEFIITKGSTNNIEIEKIYIQSSGSSFPVSYCMSQKIEIYKEE